MHESYDDHDEEYEDDYYNNDYPPSNPYQWYYKFDIGPNTPISSWLNDMINKWIGHNPFDNSNDSWKIVNIPGFYNKKFPVSSWNPYTGKDNSFQYLGSNYQGSPIWKKQYFAVDKINTEYKLHLQSHAGHFVKQPIYYKGIFDILN